MSLTSLFLSACTPTGEAIAQALRRWPEPEEHSRDLLAGLELTDLAAPESRGGLELSCDELFDVVRIIGAHDFAQSLDLVEQSARDLASRWSAFGSVSDSPAMAFCFAAACLGAAQTSLEGVTVYAATRRQFARSILKHGAIQELLGKLGLEVLRARIVCEAIAHHDDRDLAGRPLLPALALRLAARALWSACDLGMQVSGGIGYFEEHYVRLADGRKAATASLFRQSARLLPRLEALAHVDPPLDEWRALVDAAFARHAIVAEADPRLAALHRRWLRERESCSTDTASSILQAIWLTVSLVDRPCGLLETALLFVLDAP